MDFLAFFRVVVVCLVDRSVVDIVEEHVALRRSLLRFESGSDFVVGLACVFGTGFCRFDFGIGHFDICIIDVFTEPQIEFCGNARLTDFDVEGIFGPFRTARAFDSERACAGGEGRLAREIDGERGFADRSCIDGKGVVSVCRKRKAARREACGRRT